MSPVDHISSRANPFIKDLRRLAQDAAAYRAQGAVWLEGDHLIEAALGRGRRLQTLVLAESAGTAVPQAWSQACERVVQVSDALWREFSALPSPTGLGAVLDLPAPTAMRLDDACVVLDRLQDAGNVGSILRSAAAFGIRQVLALQGTAGLWSPKVLRAGMGAHFALDLHEGLRLDDVWPLRVPLAVTSSHQGQWLHEQPPPWPCAWVFGHEGQGIDPLLLAGAQWQVRIIQPAGQESLNVASAAAICLHASAVLAVTGRL